MPCHAMPYYVVWALPLACHAAPMRAYDICLGTVATSEDNMYALQHVFFLA